MLRHEFRAMGTEVELLLDAEPGLGSELALSAAEAEFARLERLLSRFLPDSELSALNRRGSLRAGPELLELTELALAARERTRGRFDPTVHDALVAAGYDRSFDRLDPDGAIATAPAAVRCRGGVAVDRASGRIELQPGFRLDLGGIAKGYAVDRALALLAEAGPGLVNAGGDLAGTGRPWAVGVSTGDGGLTLELEEAAIATSGRDRRRWLQAGVERHHLIDPDTGAPAETDLLRVSVVAATASEAEVLAKALFLAGSAAAEREVAALGLVAVLVTLDDRTIVTGALA